MKVMINVHRMGNGTVMGVMVQRGRGPSAEIETLFDARTDPRTAEETAALVAKIVGIAVAEAITEAGGE